MRRILFFITVNLLLASLTIVAHAEVSDLPSDSADSDVEDSAPKQVDVTADQSLEWYQDDRIYVARGNAKAVRGDLVVEADVLTAHEREQPTKASGGKRGANKSVTDPTKADKNVLSNAVSQKTTASTPNHGTDASTSSTPANNPDTGDIDLMRAEGNVRIRNPGKLVTGEHALYDLNKHFMIVTGKDLMYQTEKDTVTAKDSLEYYEDKKVAVARGNAVGVRENRHVEGDVLTAEFRDTPGGENELWKMTAEGHVKVITLADVTQSDHMVYDVNRNIAIMNGHVKITRKDGTQLAGDVGEVDFDKNQSRLLNQGGGRVHALLQSKSTDKSTASKTKSPSTGTNP